jgi:hypothetical protein
VTNPYGTPYGSPYAPAQNPYPASKTMAGWSLGLALALCFAPITNLISIGLAIAVLVSGARDGRDHGKGLAIAALIVDGIVLVGFLALVITGVAAELTRDAERDPAGRVTERQEVSTMKIREGDCVDDPQLLAAREESVEAATIEAVPCRQAHDLEAYHVFNLPTKEYPGDQRAFELAAQGCLAEFQPFVGRSYRASELDFWTYYPQRASWQLFDDRAVVCVVGHPDHKTRGSLKGSGR